MHGTCLDKNLARAESRGVDGRRFYFEAGIYIGEFSLATFPSDRSWINNKNLLKKFAAYVTHAV